MTARQTADQCEMWGRIIDHVIKGEVEPLSEPTATPEWLAADATGTQHVPQVPVHIERMETGPLNFGSDWTGLFIRGDNAMVYLHALREVTNSMTSPTPEMSRVAELIGLLEATAE